MLLVSPEYFERLRGKDDVDVKARRQMRGLLKKKKDAHPYDRWVKLREVHYTLLRQAQKRRLHIAPPIDGTMSQSA
jgi:hypothetical protein